MLISSLFYLIFTTNLFSHYCFYSHFVGEKIESQRMSQLGDLVFKPKQLNFRAPDIFSSGSRMHDIEKLLSICLTSDDCNG